MGQWTHLYNNTRWRKRRAAQLQIEPLCRYCKQLGRVTVANVADHIEPHRGDPIKFEGALQSLCQVCHSAAKQREEQGTHIGCGVDGVPLGGW